MKTNHDSQIKCNTKITVTLKYLRYCYKSQNLVEMIPGLQVTDKVC